MSAMEIILAIARLYNKSSIFLLLLRINFGFNWSLLVESMPRKTPHYIEVAMPCGAGLTFTLCLGLRVYLPVNSNIYGWVDGWV